MEHMPVGRMGDAEQGKGRESSATGGRRYLAVESDRRAITEGSMEQTMRVEAFRSRETPDYMVFARAILPKIREAYQNPEYEKAFQEWKRKREAEQNAGQA